MFRAIIRVLPAATGLSALLFATLSAADPPPATYHVVSHGRPVHAGDHVELRILPAPPPGVLQAIAVTTAGGRTTSLVGPYRAPYVIPVGSAPVEVTAILAGEGWQREAKATLELVPGELSGSDDCLGEGQAFVPEYGDITGSAGDLSDMPRILRTAAPLAPAGRGGFAGTVIVRTLVCRSGQVLDAYVPPAYRDPRGALIARDPALVEAAIAAARRHVFGRGRAAAWFELPIAFRP
jgi:hypothetical protein